MHIPPRERRGLFWIGALLVALGCATGLGSEAVVEPLNKALGPSSQCSWSTARGTITRYELANHGQPTGEDDWRFAVNYAYQVHGAQYSAQQELRDFLVVGPEAPEYAEVPYVLTACPDHPDLAEAAALFRAAHDTAGFIPGRPVVVFFDPHDPGTGVLAPGLVLGGPFAYGEIVSILAMCGLPLLGAGALYQSYQKPKSDPSATHAA